MFGSPGPPRCVPASIGRARPLCRRPAQLPTYAFQRERYWRKQAGPRADASAVGLGRVEHPLLGAAVGAGGWRGVDLHRSPVAETHPWLADHVVAGVALLPGTALLELALHAGEQLDCGVVRELTLQAPLVLREDEAVQVQLLVGGARGVGCESRRRPCPYRGRRHRAGYGRDDLDAPRHRGAGPARAGRGGRADRGERGGRAWPPRASSGRRGMAARRARSRSRSTICTTNWRPSGLEYGPEFQGLRSVWRRGEELFAEVAPSERQQREATAFGLHPAAARRGAARGRRRAPAGEDGEVAAGGPRLPFSWSGVKLYAAGASALRVRLVRAGEDTLALSVADGEGATGRHRSSHWRCGRPPPATSGATRDALFAVGVDGGERVR